MLLGVKPAENQGRQENQQTGEQRFFDWTKLQFSKEVHSVRREKLIRLLQKHGGGIYLTPSHHGVSDGTTFRQLSDFLYFTGLELPQSILVVDASSATTILFVPGRDDRFESISRPRDFPGRALGDDPDLVRVSGIEDIRPIEHLDADLRAWLDRGLTVWINSGRGEIEKLKTNFVKNWTPSQELLFHLQSEYPNANIQNAFQSIPRLRMIKGPEEIEAIRRVCDLTVKAIKGAAPFIRDGVDERTLEAELEAIYKRGGAQRLAFSSIIKSGPNSLWPWRILAAHYDRRNRQMRNGELVIFDVGTELDYYVSDVGRTFPISGKFSALQKQTMEMTIAVSDAIIAAIRPGVTLPELTEIAIEQTPSNERKYMQTGSFFGHHIGLDVGDPSLLEEPLTPGMVFTVEPWYYNRDKKIAVFVEDMILVTENGAENLTAALPRTTEALEALMRPTQ